MPRAKFPVIDIHSHVRPTAESIGQLIREMDELNLRVLVINSASGQRLVDQLKVIKDAGYADRFRVMADVDFSNVGPGWAEKTVAQLDADLDVWGKTLSPDVLAAIDAIRWEMRDPAL